MDETATFEIELRSFQRFPHTNHVIMDIEWVRSPPIALLFLPCNIALRPNGPWTCPSKWTAEVYGMIYFDAVSTDAHVRQRFWKEKVSNYFTDRIVKHFNEESWRRRRLSRSNSVPDEIIWVWHFRLFSRSRRFSLVENSSFGCTNNFSDMIICNLCVCQES